jgi:hypothetical protein
LKLVILEVMNIPRVLVGRLVNNWKIVVPVIAATGTVASVSTWVAKPQVHAEL